MLATKPSSGACGERLVVDSISFGTLTDSDSDGPSSSVRGERVNFVC